MKNTNPIRMIENLSIQYPLGVIATGTHEVLADATEFVNVIEKRTGLKIVWRCGWVDKTYLLKHIEGQKHTYYDLCEKIGEISSNKLNNNN